MTTAISTQTPTTHTPTPNSHFAAMRRYEDAARSVSVRRSAGSIPASELEAAMATQESYYLLAAAYRCAAHRRERAERFAASRPGTLLRVIGRGVRAVRSAVAA